MRNRILLTGVASLSALAGFANSQIITFQEVTVPRGLTGYTMPVPGQGGGVIAADYDNDGDVDIFAPTDNGTPDRLYQNQGNGTYIEKAAALGVASTRNNRAALWFDYDGDGDLDLLVARDSYLDPPNLGGDTLLFYRYDAGPGTYTDVTVAAGLGGYMLYDIPTHIGGLAAGDLNNDGWIDFVMAQWNGENYVFRNNGNGTFSDISVASGLGNTTTPRERYWQPIMFDVNNDGWLDIFFCVDFFPNKLCVNNKNGTFTDIAASAGVDYDWNEMGVTLADYNGDGKIDIYITNIDELDDGVQEHNTLFRNDTGPGVFFTDVSESLDVDNGYWGWGATFIDGDRDMFVDIAEVNGNPNFGAYNNKPSRYFRNTGTGFEDASASVNFAGANNGSSLNAFDADRDGDLDLLQTCTATCTLMLLDNVQGTSASNHYIVIKPRMDGHNRSAIGAEVKIVAGGRTQVKVITAGSSFLGQEPSEAFFGLGSNTIVTQVTIRWPSGGGTTTHSNLPADQVRTINHFNCPGDVDNSGAVNVTDLFALLALWGTNGSANPRVDLDSNGNVSVTDLFALLANWGACD